jgi:hypothetical protein
MLLVSLAVVALAMLLAGRLGGMTAAILAGLAVALSPLHITHSTLVRSSDIMMSVFLLLGGYLCLSILRSPADGTSNGVLWRYYGLAGLMAGFAVSSKYYGVFCAAGIVVAHFLAWGKDWPKFKLLAFAGLASVLGILLSGPYLLLDFSHVLAAVADENQSRHLSANGPGFFEDIKWFLAVIARQGIGLFLCFAACIGALIRFGKDWRESTVVLVVPLFLLIFMSSLSLRWDRWTLGLIPFAAVYASLPLALVLNLNKRLKPGGLWMVGALALILVSFSWNVRASVGSVRWLGVPDTRELAHQWIRENIPAQATLFVEVQGPQPSKDLYRIVGAIPESGELVILDGTSEGFLHPAPRTIILNLQSIDDLQRAGVDYVVLTNFEQRLRQSRFPETYRREMALYEELHQVSRPVYSSESERRVRGPPIRILEMEEADGPIGAERSTRDA